MAKLVEVFGKTYNKDRIKVLAEDLGLKYRPRLNIISNSTKSFVFSLERYHCYCDRDRTLLTEVDGVLIKQEGTSWYLKQSLSTLNSLLDFFSITTDLDFNLGFFKENELTLDAMHDYIAGEVIGRVNTLRNSKYKREQVEALWELCGYGVEKENWIDISHVTFNNENSYSRYLDQLKRLSLAFKKEMEPKITRQELDKLIEDNQCLLYRHEHYGFLQQELKKKKLERNVQTWLS